jgi:hypothetical protein
MLQGSIDAVGQIHVPIELIMADGGRSTFTALLDTGFTGSIGIRRALLPVLDGSYTAISKLPSQAGLSPCKYTLVKSSLMVSIRWCEP